MPYKDPEKRREAAREYGRAYAQRNPEKERQRHRRYRESTAEQRRERYNSDPEYRERILAGQRESYAKNRESILERNRAYSRKRYIENRQKVLESNRKFRSANRERIVAARMMAHHGPDAATAWAIMWDAQDGRCYLCGEEMTTARGQGPPPTAAVVDHDHRHCPPETSCNVCRRGLACNRCNSMIGLVKDDPVLLRLIAANLHAAAAAVTERMADAPQQEALPFPARLQAVG